MDIKRKIIITLTSDEVRNAIVAYISASTGHLADPKDITLATEKLPPEYSYAMQKVKLFPGATVEIEDENQGKE